MIRRIFAIASLLSALPPSLLVAQSLDLHPGTERWVVKTSLADQPARKHLTFEELLSLASPVRRSSEAPESSRIAATVLPGNVKEGDLVTTTAWLHLVALERESGSHRDGDYHIQLRSSGTWGDSCLIVEVPYPDFVADPALRASCSMVRAFIREKLLRGKEPGTQGNIMQHRVHVSVTGQLFFDATHLRNDGTVAPRGKCGRSATPMHSYTAWEIHPVISMKFAPAP